MNKSKCNVVCAAVVTSDTHSLVTEMADGVNLLLSSTPLMSLHNAAQTIGIS